MKSALQLIAILVFSLCIAACGGSSGTSSDNGSSSQVTALVKNDTVVGTGTEVTVPSLVKIDYTAWLYDANASDKRGTQFATSSGTGNSPLSFTVGMGSVIPGLEQGVLGMKVGGKRTLTIPSALGYGSGSSGAVPPNSALIFDVELLSVANSGSASVTTLKKIDTVAGSGAAATATSEVSVHYTGWLYDAKAPSFKGTKFESSIDLGKPFSFKLGAGNVIKGWDQGIVGMKVGGKRTLIIPSSLAYGSSGFSSIPPGAALVFDIELLSVKN